MIHRNMVKNNTATETIRIRRHTKLALCKAAYPPPLSCASLAEFLGMVERGDLEAISLWQKAAKELRE